MQRYITKKPKLKASKDLQKIMQRLTFTNQTIFTKRLDVWYKIYKDFWLKKHSMKLQEKKIINMKN